MMEFYNEQHHTARKPHVCECCGEKILPGQKYVQHTRKFEGDFFTRAWCADCEVVMNYYCCELAADEYFDYDGADEDIQDVFCSYCEHRHNDDCEQPDRWHCPMIHKKIEDFYAERRRRAGI